MLQGGSRGRRFSLYERVARHHEPLPGADPAVGLPAVKCLEREVHEIGLIAACGVGKGVLTPKGNAPFDLSRATRATIFGAVKQSEIVTYFMSRQSARR